MDRRLTVNVTLQSALLFRHIQERSLQENSLHIYWGDNEFKHWRRKQLLWLGYFVALPSSPVELGDSVFKQATTFLSRSLCTRHSWPIIGNLTSVLDFVSGLQNPCILKCQLEAPLSSCSRPSDLSVDTSMSHLRCRIWAERVGSI
jgi:hypothetical protein